MTALVLTAHVAAADDLPAVFSCENEIDDWAVTFDTVGQTADLRLRSKQVGFAIAHSVDASPGPWPRALTLVSDRDTAIALIDGPGQGIVLLTQDRGLPVVFTGTCALRP